MKLISWKKNKNAEEMFPISYRDIEKNVFGHVWGVERNLNKFLKSVFIFHLAMRELIRGRVRRYERDSFKKNIHCKLKE